MMQRDWAMYSRQGGRADDVDDDDDDDGGGGGGGGGGGELACRSGASQLKVWSARKAKQGPVTQDV